MNLPFDFHSLRVRLIVGVVLIEIVMLSLLVWSNLDVIRQAHADRLRDSAAGILEQVTSTTGSYLVEVDYAALEEYLRGLARHEELVYLAVLDRDRRPVITIGTLPSQPWPGIDEDPLKVDDGRLDLADDIRIAGYSLGQVRLGFTLDHMYGAIASARWRSIVIAATEIALTILVTVLFGIRLTRRLGDLAVAARRVQAGDYGVKVEPGRLDEVGTTAQAFNRMVEEISRRTRRLREALARERVIEETAIDGMLTYDERACILSANPAMFSLFGYTETELLGQQLGLLLEDMTPADWLKLTGARCEATGIRKDGERFPLEFYVGCVEIKGEMLYAITLHDITERKRAEHECMSLLEGNRFLIHKSLAVQEEERRKLARELHDELGQCTTAIQADAALIYERSRDQNRPIATSARAILDVSARIYDVVHSMMQRLRPAVLDDLGLVAALQEEVDAWRARHPGIDCRLESPEGLEGLGEAINISVYRIVQEALTNVARHASARQVGIHLQLEPALAGTPQRLRLSIHDDGRGMQPDPASRGLGLIGMRERVEALGGHFTIHTADGEGVHIDIHIPVSEAGE
ncbi:MAG TPA: PAS domain S-box protein [Gammaproteobacteria bacterium]|nr:PAS domain S-box protein [Gammaproteobacteria bacterium]